MVTTTPEWQVDIDAVHDTSLGEWTTDSEENISKGAIKYDGGKPAVWRGLISYFPRALWKVAEVSTFGAEKYDWNGWNEVPDGFARYKDAQFRHALKDAMGEVVDGDSKLVHLAHEAWGALATLELYMREEYGFETDYSGDLISTDDA